MVNLTVMGIALHGEGGGPVLLLHPHGAESILTLHIGPMEAFAISTALHGNERPADASRLQMDAEGQQALAAMRNLLRSGSAFFAEEGLGFSPSASRPMTHDLILHLVRSLGGKLTGVDITRVENGIYYAEILLVGNAGPVRVDCRPSDGIALALRCGATLRASPAVLAHARDMEAVMASLPLHIRALAEAALQTEEKTIIERATPDFSQAPPVAEPLPARQDRPSRPAPVVTLTPSPARHKPASGGAAKPAIRVALVRQDKGNTEVIEEFHLSVEDSSKKTEPSKRPNADASEDERWSALLQALSPETKVPM
jgi:bifunctional DNase/RNase